MPRSPLSTGFGSIDRSDDSLTEPEFFTPADGSLPPMSELILSAGISEDEVVDAIAQWRKEFPDAQYRLILDAEKT